MSFKNWEEMILSDICNNVQYGYTQSAIYKKIGPKFLRITDIRNNFISWDNVPFCQINKQNYKRYKLEEGDIVIARTGATTGINKYIDKNVPDAVFASYLVRLKINKLNDPKFIYYILSSKNYKEYIKSYIGGSAQPNANAKTLTSFKVKIPNLLEQKNISAILSSLDDKIELNNQINKNLEQMAQAIFKHWFIDFEFPNENGEPYKSSGGEMVDCELGPIPKGWEIKKVGEILKTVLGGTPSRKKNIYWENGKMPWINSGKVNDYRIIEPSEYITELGLEKSSTKLLPKRTTVIAITGATLGKISLLEIDCCANQSIVGILENNIFKSEYIYIWMINIIDRLISWQTGGAQQHINKDNINKFGILVPSEKILLKYYRQTKPIFNKISNNCIESKYLQNLRDTLLPKLISGEIRII